MERIISQSINDRSVLVAACACGVVGVLVFALLPMVLGVTATHFALNDSQAGLLASAYFGSYAVITLSSAFWVRDFSWRTLAAVSMCTMALSIGAILFFKSYLVTLLGLSVCGVGAAVVHALGYIIVSDRQDKDRGFAIKLIPEQLVPAILLIALSFYFVDLVNFFSLFSSMLTVVLLCMLLVPFMPTSGSTGYQKIEIKGSGAVALGLVALMLYFAGFAGLWAFFERIASDGSMETEVTAQLISLGLISSAAGPFVAAWLGVRFGRVKPLLVSLALVTLPLLLLQDLSVSKYAVVMLLLPAGWFFGNAYFYTIITLHDQSERMAGLIPFALALGALIGPGLFVAAKEAFGLSGSYWVSAGLFVLGTSIILKLDQVATRGS
jgi:predicted MFS family arabinose efflux permease